MCTELNYLRILSSIGLMWSCSSSGSIVSDYGLDDRGSIPNRGRGFFLLAPASRSAQGPTQPPIQWVLGVLSLGVKPGPGCDADHLPLSSAEVNNE
jgi:hypothetical protein